MPFLELLDSRLGLSFHVHKNVYVAVSEQTHADIQEPVKACIGIPTLHNSFQHTVLERFELEGTWLYLLDAMEDTAAIKLVCKRILHLIVAFQVFVTVVCLRWILTPFLYYCKLVEFTDVGRIF